MNRKERVDLNRARRRVSCLFLMCSLYWIKGLYEDIDSIKVDKSFIQISINNKDTTISRLTLYVLLISILIFITFFQIIKPV